MDWRFGILACLDAHLPEPGGRGEDLGFPTGQETLTALGNGEGGGEGVGEWDGIGRRGGSGKSVFAYLNKQIGKKESRDS